MSIHPFLADYRAMIGDLAVPTPRRHEELDEAFETMRRRRFPEEPALRFVPSPPKKRRRKRTNEIVTARQTYDGRIAVDREVPTRAGDLHDHCNFLVWLSFPRAKRAIHERQLRAKEAWIPEGSTRMPGARTREQDALTLFDEGGAVLVDAGAPGASSRLVVFGHALLEHFVRSDVPIAATTMRVGACETLDGIDRAIAARVRDEGSFLAPGLDGLIVLDARGGYSLAPAGVPR